MFTNNDIVIYNKIFDTSIRNWKYRPVVIKNVFVEGTVGVGTLNQGLDPENKVVVYVPKIALDKLPLEYLEPMEFNMTEDKSKVFTVAPGDRLVIGSKVYDIKELDKYKEGYTISQVDNKFFGSYSMQHLVVGGK